MNQIKYLLSSKNKVKNGTSYLLCCRFRKNWATDVPGESFVYVLSEWKKKNSNNKNKKEMKDFISNECPNWSEWAT